MSGIVQRLKSMGEAEIPTDAICELGMLGLVMLSLDSLDAVAYIAFASACKNFHAAREFLQFLGNLDDEDTID